MGRHALIIGNDQYIDPKLKTLKSPSADARALVEVLEDKSIGGFDEVKSVLNQSGEKIRREISSFLSKKKSDDLVLVYFSGHGVLDSQGRLYLALNDTEVDLLRATAIPSTYVSDEMDNCSSKRKILILDCCHSGAFSRVGLKSGDQKSVTESTFQGNGYGRVVLTASGATQFALEGDKIDENITLSLFTHYLVDGLKNGAADKNGDGQVSLDEWYDYAYSCILEKTPNQTPHKWTYQQQGDLLIAKSPVLAKKNPAKLPTEIVKALGPKQSPNVRAGAVRDLGELLRGGDPALADAARALLEKLTTDDSLKVSNTAKEELNPVVDKSPQTATPVQQQPVKIEEKKSAEKPKAVGEPSKSTVIKENKPIEEKKTVVGEKLQTSSQPKPEKSDFDQYGHPTKEWIEENKITLSNGMELMRVHAGKFLMGSAKENRSTSTDERPQHTVNIPYDYWIARYPVTNELYNGYVQAKGIKHPLDRWFSSWRDKKDHPVTYVVHWTVAREYCAWLNNLLKDELPSGLILRLPTEAEWEKAARGADALEYPYGNTFDKNKCNTNEGGKGGTTPVGLYSPQGDSPYGCADMSGNVWEWTHSLLKPYPYRANDGREDEKVSANRVLRGGSFFDSEGYARCAYRFNPFLAYENLWGFRVVVAPPNLS